MDITWLTERIALGGGIWNARNMDELARAGVTHVLDMQIEFDDTPLAEGHGVQVLWNPTDDDFLPKPPEVLKRGVEFALEALNGAGTALHSLRSRGAPGADDGAGGTVRDGMGNGSGHGADRNAAAGGGFRGRVCRERAAVCGVAGRERTAEFRLTIGLELEGTCGVFFGRPQWGS